LRVAEPDKFEMGQDFLMRQSDKYTTLTQHCPSFWVNSEDLGLWVNILKSRLTIHSKEL